MVERCKYGDDESCKSSSARATAVEQYRSNRCSGLTMGK